jgi:hypothetical protein
MSAAGEAKPSQGPKGASPREPARGRRDVDRFPAEVHEAER